ncbi:hypothetical protein HPB47_016473 [Ixodes persulcatus]|uniref:Uncharacterized protein n=1 Tax=Ixodes persulcatus TaxID=34615 RepID=A0AC60QQU3_IXOPE|nr:hypothetical protein HPB47_016473 [Ixodes persulcatus]
MAVIWMIVVEQRYEAGSAMPVPPSYRNERRKKRGPTFLFLPPNRNERHPLHHTAQREKTTTTSACTAGPWGLDDYMDSPRPPDSPFTTLPPEDMNFPALEVTENSPAELGLAGNTGFSFPLPLLLLSHFNPFAPLATLENAQQSEGKSDDPLTASCIASTATEGQKRARSTVQASTASKRSTQERTSARSPPAPWLSRLTVILRPCQPSRILDEPYIKLDESLSSHLRTSLALVQGTRTPDFTTRFLIHSNQLALDVYDPTVRGAFLKIKSLPIRGKEAPFQAYQATGEGQIRGIIQNAGGLTQEQLMASLHCSKCRILNARPLGDNGSAFFTFESTRLPYRIGLRSLTVRVLPYKPKVAVCTTCHRMGHVKERCPNTNNARSTDKGCLKRTELNKKTARRRRPKAPRRIRTTVDNQGRPLHDGRRTEAAWKRERPTTPTAHRHSDFKKFLHRARTSAQETTATAAERKLTFADAVWMANADTATQTINTTQREDLNLLRNREPRASRNRWHK